MPITSTVMMYSRFNYSSAYCNFSLINSSINRQQQRQPWEPADTVPWSPSHWDNDNMSTTTTSTTASDNNTLGDNSDDDVSVVTSMTSSSSTCQSYSSGGSVTPSHSPQPPRDTGHQLLQGDHCSSDSAISVDSSIVSDTSIIFFILSIKRFISILW